MNRRLITYNYLKTIANGSIHFHAFSYQYPGTADSTCIRVWVAHTPRGGLMARLFSAV